jgi:drug/metabolite transporter (DMT)-like permease
MQPAGLGYMCSPTSNSHLVLAACCLPNVFLLFLLMLFYFHHTTTTILSGFITTAVNRFIETTSLGKVASAEASVILATEPLWAALFAALWLNESFGANDYVGGALIVAACLANTLKPADFSRFFKGEEQEDTLAP